MKQIVCLTVLCIVGCQHQKEQTPEALPGPDEVAELDVTSTSTLVPIGQATTSGLQIATFKNHADYPIYVYAWHNGCDKNLNPGLCYEELVQPGQQTTFTPSGPTRSYDDIVRAFTIVGEVVMLATTVALAVVTAGAASPLVGLETADVAATTGAEVAAGVSDAAAANVSTLTATGATMAAGDAADVADGAIGVTTNTSSNMLKIEVGTAFKISTTADTVVATTDGGLKGGYQNGLGSAISAGVQALMTDIVGAGYGEFTQLSRLSRWSASLGPSATSLLGRSIADLRTIGQDFAQLAAKATKAIGGPGLVFEKFTNYLIRQSTASSDYIGALLRTMVKENISVNHVYYFAFKKIISDGFPQLAETLSKRGQEGFFTLTYQTGRLVLKHVMAAADPSETQSVEIVPLTMDLLRAIVDQIVTHPDARQTLDENTAEFVRRHIPLERSVSALTVALNLHKKFNSPTLDKHLQTIFDHRSEWSNLYSTYLPPQLRDAATLLHERYDLALSQENHGLRVRVTVQDQTPPDAIREALVNSEDDGFLVPKALLDEYSYNPVHALVDIDRQNVQNLLTITRIAMGLPVPIDLWANHEWNYTVEYNGKLFRNISGFFIDPDQQPSVDDWHIPFYPPTHPSHNAHWQEVVGFTNVMGGFHSGMLSENDIPLTLEKNTPRSKHLFIDDENVLELTSVDIGPDETSMDVFQNWQRDNAHAHDPILPRSTETALMVTLSTEETIDWWKGAAVTLTCGDVVQTGHLEVGADGVDSAHIFDIQPMQAQSSQNGECTLTVQFEAAKIAGFPVSVGRTSYAIGWAFNEDEDGQLRAKSPGQHVKIKWVTDGGADSPFYGIQPEYNIFNDGSNIIAATQSKLADDQRATITFAVGDDLSGWKGLAVETRSGSKIWMGADGEDVLDPKTITVVDPEKNWGKYVHVELWSQGAFGIHEYRSRIKIKSADLLGYETTFRWVNDHVEARSIQGSYTVEGNELAVTYSPIENCDLDHGYATVQLQLGPGVDWWKSLQFEYDGQTAILETSGGNGSTEAFTIKADKLAKPGVLVLQVWLAVVFGIHEHWGNIPILFDSMICKAIVFTWKTN